MIIGRAQPPPGRVGKVRWAPSIHHVAQRSSARRIESARDPRERGHTTTHHLTHPPAAMAEDGRPAWMSRSNVTRPSEPGIGGGDMPECGVVTDPDAYYIDAIDGRLAPGEGSIPVAAMTRALPANLPISLEIRSRYYRERYPDHVERARVILERTRAFLADLTADTDTE